MGSGGRCGRCRLRPFMGAGARLACDSLWLVVVVSGW